MAGYSQTPLLKKLGYKEGDSINLRGGPDWLVAKLIAGNIKVTNATNTTWAHWFVYSVSELNHQLASFPLEDIEKGLWVSWPKKTSKLKTDLTEQALRNLILPIGWVDIKVAAIDD